MNKTIEKEIQEHEDRLTEAMLRSDVNVLDELLSSDLVLTNHLGHLMTKQDDLEAHKSGILKIETLTPSEQRIQILNDVAIVTVKVHILGSFAGVSSESDFRFTRVWARSSNNLWQIITAHSCIST